MRKRHLYIVVAVYSAACSSATRTTAVGVSPSAAPTSPVMVAGSSRIINPADVEFMSGMIPHHAQAVLMAGWAKSHGARPDVLALCERVVVGQTDEIHLIQHWLRERGLEVPPENAKTHKMMMNGQMHEMVMPGMLTDEQMAALDKARGPEWDRLFLEGMIGHHAGAIMMVNTLNSSPGGATDDLVYRFSADVFADQTTEMERMQKMLDGVKPGGRP